MKCSPLSVAGVLICLICGTVTLAADSVSTTPKPRPAEAYSEVTSDGAWCWFSDPRAVRHDGRVYTGWMSVDGSVMAGAIDASGRVVQKSILHKQLERDDHDNPSFLFLPDGRLAAFYAKHGDSHVRMRITVRSGDISEWEPEQRLSLLRPGRRDRGVTYANPILLSSEANKIFVFSRAINYKPTLITSTDLGKTWSKPRVVISRPKANNRNRPYVKYWNNGRDRIDFLFTDGHPLVEPTNSVYFMRYEKGVFYKADGTRIAGMDELPIDPAKVDRIYDGATAGRAWVWDIAEDSKGNPVCLYTRMPGDKKNALGLDHHYRYARWDGQKWIDHEIVQGGKWFPHTRPGVKEREPFYSAGMTLDPADPSTVYYAAPGGEHFEIFRATTPDGGATWQTQPITANSAHDNVRPYAPRGPAGSPSVLWMNLRSYPHFRTYDGSIRCDVLEEE